MLAMWREWPAIGAPLEGRWRAWGPNVLLLLGLGAALPMLPASHGFVLLVFAPVVEELVFRAGLQEAMLRRGWPRALANVGAALAFGAVHGLLRSAELGLAVIVPALILGALYNRARRVWPCIALHAAMNACWLLLLHFAHGLAVAYR